MRSFFLLLSSMLFPALCCCQEEIVVNQDRLEKKIMELARFGQKPNGEGNRVAFSDGDIAARAFTIDLMEKAGLTTFIDYAGNIIGTREGQDPEKKAIAFGSHIDMVPNGGNYDGCVGAMAAIEIIEVLSENDITTLHPLEVIIFSNEEGGVMGSRAIAGELADDALSVKNSTGYTMAEGMRRIGGDPDKLDEVVRKKGDLAAFLELHIEQGSTLEEKDLDIGVVEGIVGLNWWDVEFTGFANHAGTTPMNRRQDALLAAAQFIIAVNEITKSFDGNQVGTVGRITAEPGAPNVIPGRVLLSLEIRDLSSEKIQQVYKAIEEKGKQIATATNTQVKFIPLSTTGKPALTDTKIQKLITTTAQMLGLSNLTMPSGAGHDAQDMALIAPTGMIFVPSKGGISHSPKEFTTAKDMANGANVLLHTLLQIDKEWN